MLTRLYTVLIVVAALAAFAFGLMFSWLNSSSVAINFGWVELTLPIGLWLLGALAIGVLLGIAASSLMLLRYGRRA